MPGWLGAAVANASLRTRVMAAAAILIALTSLATGLIGTTLLRGYLLGKTDTQLQDFASVASRALARSHLPVPGAGQRQGLPTQFLVEVVGPGGRIQVAGDPLSHVAAIKLSAAQLADSKGPFTAQAGDPAHSWRVVVRPIAGGRHAVIAFSMDDLSNAVTHLTARRRAGRDGGGRAPRGDRPAAHPHRPPTAAHDRGDSRGNRCRRPVPAHRPPVKPHQVAGSAAPFFDSMLSRIEAAYQAREEGEARAIGSEDRMRQFVADASHELRTRRPLPAGSPNTAFSKATRPVPPNFSG